MKKLLLTMAAVIGTCSLFAQREADLKFTLVTPVNGQTYNNGDTFKTKYEFKNLGPASWIPGDTILCGRPGDQTAAQYILNRTVPMNDTISRIFFNSTVLGRDTPYTTRVCYVAIIKNATNPITDANNNINENTFNNGDCKSIRINPKPVSIADVNAATLPLTIYPNPANKELFFDSDDFTNEAFDIRIFDMTGRVALTQSFKNGNGGKKINIEQLNTGIYQISITQDGHRYIGKFLKQ